jgi:hypothetical protein
VSTDLFTALLLTNLLLSFSTVELPTGSALVVSKFLVELGLREVLGGMRRHVDGNSTKV